MMTRTFSLPARHEAVGAHSWLRKRRDTWNAPRQLGAWFAIAVLMPLSSAAQGSTADSARILFEQADALAAQGDYNSILNSRVLWQRAVQAYERAGETADEAVARLRLGETYTQLGWATAGVR